MKNIRLKSPRKKLFQVFNGLFFSILILTMLLPLWNSFVVSISSNLSSMSVGLKLWPYDFNLEGYKTIWSKMELWRPFLNNIFVTVIGTILHVFFVAMTGYVLIQRNLLGKKMIITLIFITMAVPQEAIMIPLYIVNKELGLLNTLSSLIISGLVSGFSILLMRNFFLTIPEEVAESARMDGAGEFSIFRKLYLPLAKPGLATVLLFEFVSRWNQFTAALLYIDDTSKYTLQLALQSLVIASDSTSNSSFFTPNARMAGVMIAIIPLLIIYPFVQKYFVKGITLGSTKE